MPNFPERWSIPPAEIRQKLMAVFVDDIDDDDIPIKRKLTAKEISKLVKHWKDMIKYSQWHFKDVFDPVIVQARPYLNFVAVDDHHTCDFCKSLHNKVIRSDDLRSAQFFPPLHIGCRCTMVSLSKRELERDGYIEDWPDINLPDAFSVSLLI